MNRLLFERSTGVRGPQSFARLYATQLLSAIQPAPNLRFDGGETSHSIDDDDQRPESSSHTKEEAVPKIWAHQEGVNALAIDRFEGRLLLSGGAGSSIKIWDLDSSSTLSGVQTLKPRGIISKTSNAHKFGITHLSFYPFDSAAFLSSSYDHYLKLYSTDTLETSASFDLGSIIYTHALSPIASHLLVACATQHPAIRLVDLRTSYSAQSLAGHHGALLSLAWSPTSEHILASGGADGTIRLWDIRKSAGTLGVLDIEDSTGVVGRDGLGLAARPRDSGKAHHEAVNGISWTDDGMHLISAGQDNHVRVWNASTGANTLASFGPTLKNSHLSTLPLLTSPTSMTPPGKVLLYYPNEQEILVFELHDGKLLKRLKVPGPSIAAVRSRTGERNVKNRVTSMAWWGVVEGICSGHSDGQIRVWKPRIGEDDMVDKEEEEERRMGTDVEDVVLKKRKALDDVFRDLTRQKITFG